MVSADKPVFDIDTPGGISTDLTESIEASDWLNEELSFLFGKETVDQACQIDIADAYLWMITCNGLLISWSQVRFLYGPPS